MCAFHDKCVCVLVMKMCVTYMYVAILVIIIINIIVVLQVQGRTETESDMQNGQESRTVQVSYLLLIFSAYLLLKTSDNVLAIKGVYKRANAFLDIHVFRYNNSMLVSFS